MVKDDYSLIGYISKPHGTGGCVTIYLNADIADDLNPGEPVFLEINETLVPFFIEEVEGFTERAVLKLEFINSIDEARKYIGSKVYFSTPDSKYDNNISLRGASALIGYELTDIVSGITGTISGTANTSSNPLFEFRTGEKDFLIPIQSDLVLSIDHKQRKIKMKLPEGLIS